MQTSGLNVANGVAQGCAMALQGKLGPARAIFDEASAIDPACAPANFNRG